MCYGGKWTVILSNKDGLETMWLETPMALIGEQFEEAEEIYGVVVNVRKRQDKIATWTRNTSNEVVQIYKAVCLVDSPIQSLLIIASNKLKLSLPGILSILWCTASIISYQSYLFAVQLHCCFQ